MSGRYPMAAVLSAAITFGIFTVMQSLVSREAGELKDVKVGRIVDFVRLKRDTQPEVKKRELPPRQQPEKEPPPPEIDMSQLPAPNALEIAAAMPAFEPQMEMAAGPGGAGGNSDSDAVPLVRVSPQYPPRAMARGVEGWVHLRFTVTEAGTVRDVQVVKAEPRNYFEEAAMNAVRKYKYKPKVENGNPVARQGVEVIISFRLQT